MDTTSQSSLICDNCERRWGSCWDFSDCLAVAPLLHPWSWIAHGRSSHTSAGPSSLFDLLPTWDNFRRSKPFLSQRLILITAHQNFTMIYLLVACSPSIRTSPQALIIQIIFAGGHCEIWSTSWLKHYEASLTFISSLIWEYKDNFCILSFLASAFIVKQDQGTCRWESIHS